MNWLAVKDRTQEELTSGVRVGHGLAVLSVVCGNARDDDHPVGLVGEGLVVAVAAGGAAADGGSLVSLFQTFFLAFQPK